MKSFRTKPKSKLNIDDILTELEEARQLALDEHKPSAAIAASLGKAKLLGLDKGEMVEEEAQPVKVVIQTVDARVKRDGGELVS